MKLLKDESLVASWQNFLEEDYHSDIETIALSYPQKRSLLVDYWNIDKFDSTLADILINQPYKAIFNAEEALKNIDVAAEHKLHLHFRVYDLHEIQKLLIRQIRATHLGKYGAIEGLIKKTTEVRPKLQVAAFQCQKCGAIIKIDQEEDILKEPSECYEDQGGWTEIETFIPFEVYNKTYNVSYSVIPPNFSSSLHSAPPEYPYITFDAGYIWRKPKDNYFGANTNDVCTG